MIYYSNVNEDNIVERRILNFEAFRDLYCIAGSGERLISLLDSLSLKRVFVIDNNKEALFLTQLKLIALKNLSISRYLEFIGVQTSLNKRVALFQIFEEELPIKCRVYWRSRLDLVEKGVLNSGHFEKFLSQIRPLLKNYLGKHFYECFKKPFNSIHSFPIKRWALIRHIFSKRQAYLLAGNKDPSFTAKDAKQSIIPAALHKTIKEGKVSQNSLFHLVFNGHFNEMPKNLIPPSLDEKVLEKVKKRMEEKAFEIYYHQSDLLDFCKRHKFNRKVLAFFSLSDILSFNGTDYINHIIRQIKNNTKTGSMIIFRAFLRNRIEPDELKLLRSEFSFVNDLSDLEKTGMYQVILLKI